MRSVFGRHRAEASVLMRGVHGCYARIQFREFSPWSLGSLYLLEGRLGDLPQWVRRGDLLVSYGLIELGELLIPFRGFISLVGDFVESHQTIKRIAQAKLPCRRKTGQLLFEAFIARKQERLGFGVFFTFHQNATQNAACIKQKPY